MRRDNDHAQPRRAGLQFFEQPDAVHLVHAQVGDHQVRGEAVQGRQRLVSALDGFNVVALRTQADAKQAQQSRIVVDQQDLAFTLGVWICHRCRLERFS